MCIDDTLLFAPDMKGIDDVLRKLQEDKHMLFGIKDEVARFLGVNIDHSKNGGSL